MVTIRDVAKHAGVSIASVSRALNGQDNVRAKTREKIEASARELKFVPHSGARSLTNQRTHTIGVILPDLFGEFFSEIIRGIDRITHGAGKQMLLGNMHGSLHETANAIRSMRGRVDGILLMPPNGVSEPLTTEALGFVPTVLLNVEPGAHTQPFVTVDNYHGARKMTEYLIGLGCKRIVHISGPRHNRDAFQRQRGFLDAMKQHLHERQPLVLPGDFREQSGEDAVRMLLADGAPVDAIFAANDVMAVGAISALRESGIAVGEDVLVAGFDDIPMSRHMAPGLTTMHSDIARLGSTAAMLLLRMMGGEALGSEDGRVLVPEIVTRGSTGEAERGSLGSKATATLPGA
ncbi:LacI family transcriptional regulator [Erythrobacter sp. LQ02-29]|uniref:LacI family DNA-binding transcriptional regulator n=1 Tax=Erythrobacter sp. LQ02-29 TaxID=2920384 RepID=UPI001F4DA050|nr:LacI family DNA-binding transcriptional regulator [Erythrobacter sp. LQ02-29]MCP9221160.1 LacI family transcriptional regulator [Erythrobacter sp. LQ02-29]